MGHALKDREHARRSLRFLILHALHEEQEIIRMLADEMHRRGWLAPDRDECDRHKRS